ncbi:MAG: NUDIX domain-containing protein, partial [Brachybacterium tyrofermentans]
MSSRTDLAVSTVIFALRPHPTTRRLALWLPLVRRIRDPHQGLWALPGGPLAPDEGLAASAARNLRETTRLTPQYLEQ